MLCFFCFHDTTNTEIYTGEDTFSLHDALPFCVCSSDLPSKSIPATRLPVFPEAGILEGKCHIIDGDTIVIKRTKIRLAGIDAPELDQPWGQKSKWAMVAICKGQVITAKLNGERSHDRLVANCYLHNGNDIGAELIKQGLALDWSKFSGGRYKHHEQAGARRKLKQVYHR